MGLPASLIREGVKDSKGGWPKTNSKPRSSGGLLHHDRKSPHKKALDIFLFSWLGFKPDEQCYFDHDVPPTFSKYVNSGFMPLCRCGSVAPAGGIIIKFIEMFFAPAVTSEIPTYYVQMLT